MTEGSVRVDLPPRAATPARRGSERNGPHRERRLPLGRHGRTRPPRCGTRGAAAAAAPGAPAARLVEERQALAALSPRDPGSGGCAGARARRERAAPRAGARWLGPALAGRRKLDGIARRAGGQARRRAMDRDARGAGAALRRPARRRDRRGAARAPHARRPRRPRREAPPALAVARRDARSGRRRAISSSTRHRPWPSTWAAATRSRWTSGRRPPARRGRLGGVRAPGPAVARPGGRHVRDAHGHGPGTPASRRPRRPSPRRSRRSTSAPPATRGGQRSSACSPKPARATRSRSSGIC